MIKCFYGMCDEMSWNVWLNVMKCVIKYHDMCDQKSWKEWPNVMEYMIKYLLQYTTLNIIIASSIIISIG